MDRVIHKYVLNFHHQIQTLLIPGHSAKTRHIGMQDGGLYVWIEYTPDSVIELRKYYRLVWTGSRFESDTNWVYKTTIHDDDGLVWHVFEV